MGYDWKSPSLNLCLYRPPMGGGTWCSPNGLGVVGLDPYRAELPAPCLPDLPVVGIHAPRRRGWTRTPDCGIIQLMDWKAHLILAKISEGMVFREVALAVGISRQAVLKRVKKSPEFAAAVAMAREAGADERRYRKWLNHYRRGLRPPHGRSTRSVPLFRYGGGR